MGKNFGKGAIATIGGGLYILSGELIEKQLAKNPKLADNQVIVPAVGTAIGLALATFTGKNEYVQSAVLGWLGGSGADLGYQGYLALQNDDDDTGQLDPASANNAAQIQQIIAEARTAPVSMSRNPMSTPERVARPVMKMTNRPVLKSAFVNKVFTKSMAAV